MRVTAALAVFAVSFCSVAASGDQPNVVPLLDFRITPRPGGVEATGTWTTPDGKITGGHIFTPVNVARISCQQSTRQCTEALAQVIGTNPKYLKLLRVDTLEYVVTLWTKTEITAEMRDTCATSTITINLDALEVFRITRNGGISTELCKNDPRWKPLPNPLIEKLIDGGGDPRNNAPSQ